MLEYPALRIAAVVVDVILVLVLLHELLTQRIPRRWRSSVIAIVLVVLLLLAESVFYLFAAPRTTSIPEPLMHALLGLALGILAMVLRSSVLRPQRLLLQAERNADSHDVDQIPAIIMNLTRDGHIRHINSRGREILASERDRLIDKEIFEAIATKSDQNRAREDFFRFVASGGQSCCVSEYWVNTRIGERLVRWRRSAQMDQHGDVIGVVSYGEDVTEKRQIEQTLRAESYLLDAVHDSLTVTDMDGRLLYLNRSAYELLGYTRDEFIELGQYGWIAPESQAEAKRQNEKVVRLGDVLFEVTGLNKSGERMHLEIRSQSVTFEGKRAVMHVCRDVSSRQQAQELMLQMALNDPLTGLPNRRTVHDRLSVGLTRLKRRGRFLSVLYLDVDNVKHVNDHIGHDAGDALIKAVARRLKSTLREEDTVGRVGGDEFVILLPEAQEPSSAEAIAHRLLALLQEPITIHGHELRISASIGLLECEADINADEALTRADRAMYAAKRAGGNRVVRHTASLDHAIFDRLTLKHDVAVASERSELALRFQPIVWGEDQRLAGVEALVRWQHPTRGLLSPVSFIQLAEETGHIRDIGRWVLGEALATLRDLRHKGLQVERMAVNVSPAQLMDSNFVAEVMNALASADCDPSSLELEITETGAMVNMDKIQIAFDQLAAFGVRLALDDFGTGHSSLERLRRLPINTLKIDRTFVTDLCSSPSGHPIIDTIIVLASNLGLNVVAEGVETQCHLEYLSAAGCAQMQGFVFSKPVEAHELLRLAPSGIVPLAPDASKKCVGRNSCLLFAKDESDDFAAEQRPA